MPFDKFSRAAYHPTTLLARLVLTGASLAGLLVLVVACSIQGTAAPTFLERPKPAPRSPATAMPAPAAPVTATAAAVLPATVPPQPAGSTSAAPDPTHWTVGLLDEPAGILPFSPDGRVAAPITQVLFPAPVLGLGYAYTTTGVLREIPTLANGGVERRPVKGYLDASGQFTSTATAVPSTTDQLVVTFHWNPALRWADGKPLTAQDSVFAYADARRAPPSPEAEALLQSIERYEAVDASTTRAVLAPGRSDPSYPLAAWPPLPRHLLEQATSTARDKYAHAPIGYGPYTFGGAVAGKSMTLVRNTFWPGSGLRDELRFRFFTTAEDLRAAVDHGDVDVASLERIPSALYRLLDRDAAGGAAKVSFVRGPVFEHLDFNLADPLLQDLRVRRAIAHAVDRQKIVDRLFGDKTAILHSWILPDQPEYAGDEQLRRYPYDPAQARALLDAAGLRDTNGDGIREVATGRPVSLTLLTVDVPLAVEIAHRVEQDVRSVGLQIRTQALPIDRLYSPTGPLFRRQFQLAEFAWIAGAEPSGVPLWSCGAVPGPENGYTGNNFGGWCFGPAEGPLRVAASALDPRARSAAYLRQQQLWTQELPGVPLLQRPIAFLRRPGLRGVVPDPLAPVTWNVDAWRP